MEDEVVQLQIWDWILIPVLLPLIYFFAVRIKKKNILSNPCYKYYVSGLFAKIFGSIIICLVYVYYYGGGDTTDYYVGGRGMVGLLFKKPNNFFSIMMGNLTPENRNAFDNDIGWPPYYMWLDPKTFSVIRVVTWFLLISGSTYIPATILLTWASYTGVWRLYLVFCENFPDLKKQFAIAILFMPSVVFWGSGMLKDTITLSAACWLTYGLYNLVIKKKVSMVSNFIAIIISSIFLLSIKPYIFVSLMPGTILWLSFERIGRIKSLVVKFLVIPLVFATAGGVLIGIFNIVGGELGQYSNIDTMVGKAVSNQKDLTRSTQYGENYFDIGEIETTPAGMLKKAPMAIVAALFRPFLWEAKNIQMLISAIENTFLLLFFLYVFLRVGLRRCMVYIIKTPILFFSLLFSIAFAFSVGISTPNFGAMVRYKIPAIPFFVSSLFILKHYYLLNRHQTGKKRK